MNAQDLAAEELREAVDVGLKTRGSGADAVDEEPSFTGVLTGWLRGGGRIGRADD